MTVKIKKIIVTGGAGYIGSHTCKLLRSKGFEPIVLDNLTTGYRDFVKWGLLELGDLHNTQFVTDVLKKYSPEAVIHFASSAYVGESVENPFKYYRNNVGGALSLLDAMSQARVKNIVFSSTCATYGVPNIKLISEECPQTPINPYGQSKLMIEKILSDLAKKRQINQISLRYFNAAGADSACEIGERHEPETHLIPLAIRSALSGSVLKVYGSDFPTVDGTAVRDYIHVEDLASAHVLAIESLLAGTTSDFINLGTGIGTSVQEIIKSLQSIGLQVHTEVSPRRDGDPAYLVADASRASRVLGWKPNYTNITQILKTAVNWHKIDG